MTGRAIVYSSWIVIMTALALLSLKAGRVGLDPIQEVRRSERPIFYWSMIAFYIAIALVCVVLLIRDLL